MASMRFLVNALRRMHRSKCSPGWPWGACRLQVAQSPWPPWPEPSTTATNARASLCPFPLSPTF
eukprot:3741549-Pleurochrysis_carterae.AAC.4